MSSLNHVASFVSILNTAIRSHLKMVNVRRTRKIMKLTELLYINGAINSFSVANEYITIMFKYCNGKSVISNISLVSKPSKRAFWTLGVLNNKFKVSAFAGFFIVSTSKGLLTSNECLLADYVSGEIILKIEF